jgi:hypothetical protein
MYPISPCLIRGTGDHATTVGVATHDHRLAAQLRVAYPFHRDEEGIQVNM